MYMRGSQAPDRCILESSLRRLRSGPPPAALTFTDCRIWDSWYYLRCCGFLSNGSGLHQASRRAYLSEPISCEYLLPRVSASRLFPPILGLGIAYPGCQSGKIVQCCVRCINSRSFRPAGFVRILNSSFVHLILSRSLGLVWCLHVYVLCPPV